MEKAVTTPKSAGRAREALVADKNRIAEQIARAKQQLKHKSPVVRRAAEVELEALAFRQRQLGRAIDKFNKKMDACGGK